MEGPSSDVEAELRARLEEAEEAAERWQAKANRLQAVVNEQPARDIASHSRRADAAPPASRGRSSDPRHSRGRPRGCGHPVGRRRSLDHTDQPVSPVVQALVGRTATLRAALGRWDCRCSPTTRPWWSPRFLRWDRHRTHGHDERGDRIPRPLAASHRAVVRMDAGCEPSARERTRSAWRGCGCGSSFRSKNCSKNCCRRFSHSRGFVLSYMMGWTQTARGSTRVRAKAWSRKTRQDLDVAAARTAVLNSKSVQTQRVPSPSLRRSAALPRCRPARDGGDCCLLQTLLWIDRDRPLACLLLIQDTGPRTRPATLTPSIT